jgi:hypothetical protein
LKMMRMMIIRETVIWVPVVTKMTGMMMILIMIVEAEAWGQAEVSGMKTIMTIMMIQEIGEVRADIKAKVMAMKKMTIMAVPVAHIQEEDLVAWAVEWDLAMVEVPVQTLAVEADVINHQVGLIEAAVHLAVIGGMEADAVNQNMETAPAAIGAAAVAKVAIAVVIQAIQMINT